MQSYTVDCPDGFVRKSLTKCLPVVDFLVGSNYFIQVKLSPIKGKLLPWAYQIGNTPPRIWFNAKGLSLESSFKLFDFCLFVCLI